MMPIVALIFISLLRFAANTEAQNDGGNCNQRDIFFRSCMAGSESIEITRLLRAWAEGDADAIEKLAPQIYRELRRIAGNCMKAERTGRSMQATALVHEAYLRLVDISNVDWEHRAHFFAVAARIMRRILLDAARKRSASKRGGEVVRVNLNEIPDLAAVRGREMIALDDALTRLAEFDVRKARVIELRFFGGLSVTETAAVLKISTETVMRDWKLARSWLMNELNGTT
jgi:RNA polymerase sigma factor (TIGR02999 family)